MNAIIALCHFCEFHGPSVLFCTQTFHCTEHDPVDGCKVFPKDGGLLSRRSSQSSANECSTDTPKSPQPKSTQCEACRSLPADHPGFLSVDEQAHVSYTSSRNPAHQDVYSVVRQACVRSLSCEICPGREGPIFFGEDANGYVLSHTFFLKDTQARGLQRWYSIIIVMMDRIYLINSWSFLVKHFKEIIDKLQKMAAEVFSSEQAVRYERGGRFHNSRTGFTGSDVLCRQHKGSFRAIQDLTKNKNLFQYLHQYFSWILKAGAHRMTEKVLEGPPREELLTDFEAQQQMDQPESNNVTETQSTEPTETTEREFKFPVFTSLRQMLQILGLSKFHLLAYNVIKGNQLIVRGQPEELVSSVLHTLKIFIPHRCFRSVQYSDTYEESWRCNFLGLKTNAIIPSHIFESDLYVILDIKEQVCSVDQLRNDPFKRYSFVLNGKENSPSPLLLKKTEEALLNKNFSDSVVDQVLFSLKEEWMDKVKVIFKFSRSGNRSSDEKERLFKILDARPEDEIVLKFWMTGLNKEYRSHLLTCSPTPNPA